MTTLVFIEGRVESREWQSKEGQKLTSFEIVADTFTMLGDNKNRGENVSLRAPVTSPVLSYFL